MLFLDKLYEVYKSYNDVWLISISEPKEAGMKYTIKKLGKRNEK